MFDFYGFDWNQARQDRVSSTEDDRFAYALDRSVNRHTRVIGEPKDDDNSDDFGHVRVFQLDWIELNWAKRHYHAKIRVELNVIEVFIVANYCLCTSFLLLFASTGRAR